MVHEPDAIDFHRHLLPSIEDLPGLSGPHVRSLGEQQVIWADDAVYRKVDERVTGVFGSASQPAAYSAAPIGAAYDGDADYLRLLNDFLSDVTGREQEAWFFASLPVRDEQRALAELDRVLRLPRCIGVMLLAGHHDWLLTSNDSKVLAALGEAGGRIFLHPLDESVPADDRVSTFGLGMPFETARTVIRLLSSVSAYAAVGRNRWLLSHGGGALPSIVDRVTNGRSRGLGAPLAAEPLEFVSQSCWGDSALYGEIAWDVSSRLFGSDRIVYGTDFPFIPPPRLPDKDGLLAEQLTRASEHFLQGAL